jgi:hypothetical protein
MTRVAVVCSGTELLSRACSHSSFVRSVQNTRTPTSLTLLVVVSRLSALQLDVSVLQLIPSQTAPARPPDTWQCAPSPTPSKERVVASSPTVCHHCSQPRPVHRWSRRARATDAVLAVPYNQRPHRWLATFPALPPAPPGFSMQMAAGSRITRLSRFGNLHHISIASCSISAPGVCELVRRSTAPFLRHSPSPSSSPSHFPRRPLLHPLRSHICADEQRRRWVRFASGRPQADRSNSRRWSSWCTAGSAIVLDPDLVQRRVLQLSDMQRSSGGVRCLVIAPEVATMNLTMSTHVAAASDSDVGRLDATHAQRSILPRPPPQALRMSPSVCQRPRKECRMEGHCNDPQGRAINLEQTLAPDYIALHTSQTEDHRRNPGDGGRTDGAQLRIVIQCADSLVQHLWR